MLYCVSLTFKGGETVQFRKLDATFGNLDRRTLAFSPGFNVVEAPNESGKSTLAAFLRTMLFGLSTRERGTLADKNRYLPWSGAPMQGTLELETEAYGAITLRRDTARANSPMGRFAATYSGTGNEVEGLSASDCGETLLGVPREVYERSAFIRQSGLTVEPDAELERRIAALITTGEEGTSYSEAAAALKRQLNARRSNARNGLIPTLEREIEADSAALAEARSLRAEQAEAERALHDLCEQEAELRKELSLHELADKQAQYLAREQAKRDADEAAREARVFRRMLSDSGAPAREVLEENRSRLRTVEDLGRQLREADGARQDAELALSQFDARPAGPALRPVAVVYLVLLLAAAAAACAAYFYFSLPIMNSAAVYGSCAAGLVLFAVLFALECRRARNTRLARQKERDGLETALREKEAACAALKDTSESTLSLVYEAIPAGDAVGASAYVHENLARWDMLAQMEAEAQRLRQRHEDYPKPDLKDVPAYPVERPARSRDTLERELEQTAERRAQTQSAADRAAGQLQLAGDAVELETTLAEKRARLEAAQEEYDAVALAMETLEHANTALQNRFSPELGRRAAEYFSALTGGKYDAVALDRSFRALTTESGESVGRDAALLSQGASDQLYLAVRLAICDMVLPQEKHVPLVLDDALINFDNERCNAALELLVKAAETRQILLLTCQHREAAYLTGRENVRILSL